MTKKNIRNQKCMIFNVQKTWSLEQQRPELFERYSKLPYDISSTRHLIRLEREHVESFVCQQKLFGANHRRRLPRLLNEVTQPFDKVRLSLRGNGRCPISKQQLLITNLSPNLLISTVIDVVADESPIYGRFPAFLPTLNER
jgi:hypothetical protein